MEWSHMQVLYCCYFLSYISQAIFRLGFYTTRLRFIGQIFLLLPKARNWVDFHSLHCQKNRILMDIFLASWWFNLTSIWLAFELLNTFCSITRKMIMQLIHGQFLLAQAVFAASRSPLKLEPAALSHGYYTSLSRPVLTKCVLMEGSPALWRQLVNL